MDIHLWRFCVLKAKKTLQTYFPQFTNIIEENSKEYLNQLTILDNWAKQEIAKIPVEKRILITAHDAFRYFGKAYKFQVRGIQGISTASKAGVQDIKNLPIL